MALGQNLINLRARLGTVKDRFEISTSRRCVLITPDVSPTPVSPNPTITTIDSRRVERFLSPDVQIDGDEQVVTGLTRLYSRELLEASDILIDAVAGENTWTGQLCRILAIEDKSPTVWTMIVRLVEPEYTITASPQLEILSYDLGSNTLALLL
jgi:hypothetical protein